VNCRFPTNFSRFSFPHLAPLQSFNNISLRLGSKTLPCPHYSTKPLVASMIIKVSFFLVFMDVIKTKRKKHGVFFAVPEKSTFFMQKYRHFPRSFFFGKLFIRSLGLDCPAVLLHGGDRLI